MNLHEFDQQWRNCHTQHIAGVDEVGRGPLAGPVCAAAVILPADFSDSRIRDSKKLSALQRQTLSDLIRHSCLAWSVATVDCEVIDTINILHATRLAMWQALSQLPMTPELLLVDGMDNSFFPAVRGEKVIKGDNLSLSIAAASIVAKVHRDELMEALDQRYPQYGFARHKGYGTAQHRQAIREHGLCPQHRRSFCTRLQGV
ncbi:ribonuclease HII [Desulfurispirillum indicum]|uniref:ribonuclease HII n=1 Tax=Desulfurispirillum indicum TaxID=936456 RepID=UPI001CFA675B|nr:ribonuclease HII [Desulfurispirillum indicum]UCZ56166.1 ribonuclease HII [Desulfurispirillum indicum]